MPKCAHPGCEKMTMPVGTMPPCDHCKKLYCIPHQVPEGHGCGDAVKNFHRTQATRDADVTRRAKKDAGMGDAKAKLAAKRAELANDRLKKSAKK